MASGAGPCETGQVALDQAQLGGQLYRCDGCVRTEYGYHSCQNRACPKCQSDRTEAWLNAQRQRLLPTDHFLFTFTLPAPL